MYNTNTANSTFITVKLENNLPNSKHVTLCSDRLVPKILQKVFLWKNVPENYHFIPYSLLSFFKFTNIYFSYSYKVNNWLNMKLEFAKQRL